MKTSFPLRNIMFVLLLILPALACNAPASPPSEPLALEQQEQQPKAEGSPTSEPTLEPTVEATATFTEISPSPTAETIQANIVPPTTAPQKTTLPKSALSSPTDQGGTCGPGYVYDCEVLISDSSFLQFFLYLNGKELTAEDGVIQMDFRVMTADRSRIIYSHTENNSPYCIFGGSGGCASWVFEDGVYKWSQGGEQVENGTYIAIVDPLLTSGDQVHWEYYVVINLQ